MAPRLEELLSAVTVPQETSQPKRSTAAMVEEILEIVRGIRAHPADGAAEQVAGLEDVRAAKEAFLKKWKTGSKDEWVFDHTVVKTLQSKTTGEHFLIVEVPWGSMHDAEFDAMLVGYK